jgi:hypothetical protein
MTSTSTSNLNSQSLARFLDLAVKKLQGEWLLVGGTLLPAVGLDVRTTIDIDLVDINPKGGHQTLELMELADAMGLPVETVNGAAAFFVRKAGYKRSDLLPLRKSPHAVIYRPSVRLYWKLKASRLTESDLLDCQHYYNYSLTQGDTINIRDLNAILNSAGKNKSNSAEKSDRIRALRALCKTHTSIGT